MNEDRKDDFKKKKLDDKTDSTEFDIKILPNNTDREVRITQVSVKKGGNVSIEIPDYCSSLDDFVPSPEHVVSFYQYHNLPLKEEDSISSNEHLFNKSENTTSHREESSNYKKRKSYSENWQSKYSSYNFSKSHHSYGKKIFL